MEYKKFEFEPKGGFLDSNFYEDTPANSREILQRQHNQTRDYINSIVSTLNCEAEGESGLESIKCPAIEGVAGNNAYLQIKDIKKQLNEVSLNKVPDGSITEEKLADKSVSGEKIKDGGIKSENFAPDACAPLSNDTKNINNIPSERYAPVSVTGDIHFFKECVTRCDLTNLYGKTYKNTRYILFNNYLYKIDLISGEYSRVSDILLDSSYKFAIGEDGRIYVIKYTYTVASSYITIYDYNIEYGELILIKELLISSNLGIYNLSDIVCNEEYMFIGLTTNTGTTLVNFHLFKIKLSNLSTMSTINEFYTFQSFNEGALFLSGEDLVFNNRIFKNCLTDEVATIEGYPYEGDNNNLLFFNQNAILKDKYTGTPTLIAAEIPSKYSFFVHNNILYRALGGYIVKTRLF